MGDVKFAIPSEQEESADEDAEFVDAEDDVEADPASPKPLAVSGSGPSLEEGIAVAFESMNMFLSNKFDQAKEMLQDSCEVSMYHSVSYSTIMSLQAMMTMEPTDIANALDATRRTLNVVKQSRKKHSMLSWSRSRAEYTLEELHAELIYAESLLLYALVTFLEDENLISFVKAAFKVRRCYLAYNECRKLLDRFHWTSASGKADFETGVRLGYGLFNVLISILPPRIIKMLEFVGFSGDREVGLREVEIGSNIENGLRTPLCWMALLSYNLVAYYAFGLTENNLPQSEELIKKGLAKYPDSIMFLFFHGKYEQVCGRFTSAIASYERAIACQNQWQQFHHLCYWEEMITHSLLADWLLAMKCAEILYQQSRWSKALPQYLKACFMLELISEYNRHPGDKADAETVRAMQSHVSQLMEAVPGLRQRIAGKSLPIEKFAAAKATRYSKTGKICLPGVEMVFVLNWTRILASDEVSCARMLNVVDEELKARGLDPNINSPDKDFKIKKSSSSSDGDQILAIFLRGAILRELKKHDEAKRWLLACPTNWSESQLTAEATYVLPGSWIELAHIAVDARDIKLARSYLDEARSYKQYHHISRMQFRIHALQQQISVIEGSHGKNHKSALESVTNETSFAASKSKSIPTSLSSAATK